LTRGSFAGDHVCATVENTKRGASEKFFTPSGARSYGVFEPCAGAEFRHDPCNMAHRWRETLFRGGVRIYDSRLRGNDMFMIEGVSSVECRVLSRRSLWSSLPTSNFTLPMGYRRDLLYNKQSQTWANWGTWVEGRRVGGACCAKRSQSFDCGLRPSVAAGGDNIADWGQTFRLRPCPGSVVQTNRAPSKAGAIQQVLNPARSKVAARPE